MRVRPAAVVVAIVAAVAAVASLVPVRTVLEVHDGDEVVGRLPVQGSLVTVAYVHSIDGLPIEEDLEVIDGELVAQRTRVREFGAGMGQIAGDGAGRADGEWWVIDGMEREVGPELHLRVGAPAVDHRIRSGGVEYRLSPCFAGRRLTLRPTRISALAATADFLRHGSGNELEGCR